MRLHEDTDIDWIATLFSHLVQLGIPQLFEEREGRAAVVPICDTLFNLSPDSITQILFKFSHVRPINHIKSRLLSLTPHWLWLSGVLAMLLSDTTTLKCNIPEPTLVQLLQQAIVHDDDELIELLLNRGVDAHTRVKDLSAFELACFSNVKLSDKNFDRVLKYVKSNHVVIGNSSFRGRGPLHFTSGARYFPEIDGASSRLRRLLDVGVSRDLPNSYGWGTPLLYHINMGSINTVQILLEAGADPGLVCAFNGFNAVLAGIESRILAEILPSIPNDNQLWRQAFLATGQGMQFQGGNALHLTVMVGGMSQSILIYEGGFLLNLDAQDSDLQTPMHYAVRKGESDMIRYMQEKGGNIDARSKTGLTPLHLAARRGDFRVVETLLKLGAKKTVCF